MKGNMTSNLKDIETQTRLKIGKVYLLSNENEYDPQIGDDDRLFDTKTGNFHLFPKYDEIDIDAWHAYFDKENQLIKKIKKKLGSDYTVKCGSGRLVGIPDNYRNNGLNTFFRYLEVVENGRHYVILCKRFYIDSNHVNCIYGQIQFFNTGNQNGNPNKKIGDKWEIHYPRRDKDQNEDMIISDTKYKINMYDPIDLQSFFGKNLEKYADQVVVAFKSYIGEIEDKLWDQDQL